MGSSTPEVGAATATGADQSRKASGAAAKGAAPVRAGERIAALDLARGFALMGVFLCNLPMMGRPAEAAFNSLMAVKIPLMTEYFLIFEMLSGAQRAMFSMLFGAGLVLFMDRLVAKGVGAEAGDIYFRRIGWLFVFGLVNAYVFLWPGDILLIYSLVAFLAFACRNLSAKMLFALGGALLLFSMLTSLPGYLKTHDQYTAYVAADTARANGAVLGDAEVKAIETWEGKFDTSDIEARAKEARDAANHNIIYRLVVVHEIYKYSLSILLYELFFVGTLMMFLIGMGLLKVGFFEARFPAKYLWATAVISLGIAVPWRLIETQMYLFAYDPLAAKGYAIFYHLDRLLMALGSLALYALFARAPVLKAVQRLVATYGQMALSNYLGQSILAAFIFFGTGLYGYADGGHLFMALGGVIAGQLIFSAVWMRYYRFGPFEWVWRSLTYGRRMPLRR